MLWFVPATTSIYTDCYLLEPGVMSAQGHQDGQAGGAADSWGPPSDSLRENKTIVVQGGFMAVQPNKPYLR